MDYWVVVMQLNKAAGPTAGVSSMSLATVAMHASQGSTELCWCSSAR